MKKEKKETEMKGGENISQSQGDIHKRHRYFFQIFGHSSPLYQNFLGCMHCAAS